MPAYIEEKVCHNGEALEVRIEVDDQPVGRAGYYDYGLMRQTPEGKPVEAFESGMRLIRATAEKVAETVTAVGAAARPHEVTIKMGIKLNGEVGALIAKTGTEAQLQVTLKWTSPQ